MSTDAIDASVVRNLLENLELKVFLDSPDNNYHFEYITASIKDRNSDESRLSWTYRLLDLVRGTVTPEPWDSYDLDKQTRLITGLLSFARYRIAKIVCGWIATCPECGNVVRGKNWESIPKSCMVASAKKCRAKITENDIQEILVQ